MAVNTLGSPVHMPDLVIEKILKCLPTKVAFQACFLSKQWEGVISSFPALNFDEDDDLDRHRPNLNGENDYVHHKTFINFLNGYLEHLDNRKHIDKLRLHTWVSTYRDAANIDRCLEVAIERDVKELDISPILGGGDQVALSKRSWVKRYKNSIFYSIPWLTLVNAKSLTSLNLECVRVPDLLDLLAGPDRSLLPSLKTMSFTAVRLHDCSFFPLLRISSSIEYLSLTACSFEGNDQCDVYCTSLKSLEVKYCHGLRSIMVGAMNLESFTLVGYTNCSFVDVDDAPNLKKIDICVDKLKQLYLWRCHRAVEATINVQSLRLFKFYGSLEAQVSVKACWKCIIWVTELWLQEWFLSNSKNLFTLIEFLKGFGCCKKVWLCTRDSKALIIPESFRKTVGTFPTPLPESCTLNVAMPNPPKPGSRDFLDLNDFINWIAHSARIVKQNPQWLIELFANYTNGSE
ncbi:hypothetical protein ACLB2K_033710 [Fragaria x ananassa]